MDARRRAVLVLQGFLALISAFGLGRAVGDDAQWREGVAQVGGDDDAAQFSVVVDGWTYGARGSVPHWVDKANEHHSDGWPDCLRPPTPAHPERPSRVPVRFETVDVDTERGARGLVLSVDCRRAPAS